MIRKLAPLLLLACLAAPASAGLDIDFGASVTLGDEDDLFLSVSARYFDEEPREVERWRARYADPDDLAVALFLSRSSGKSPDVIFRLRRHGMSWWDVSLRGFF